MSSAAGRIRGMPAGLVRASGPQDDASRVSERCAGSSTFPGHRTRKRSSKMFSFETRGLATRSVVHVGVLEMVE